MNIGRCLCHKASSRPLQPLYKLLEDIGPIITQNDCLETQLSVEIAILEIASNIVCHSDSKSFDCIVDADSNGILITICDWTATTFQPETIYSQAEAMDRLKNLPQDQFNGRGLLLVSSVVDSIEFVDNFITMFIRWREEGKS